MQPMLEHHAFCHRSTAARRSRCGYSLLELIGVLAIIGILSAATVATMAPETMQDLGAQTEARRIAADLQHARRRAVSTGDNHYLQLQSSGGSVVGYTLMQRASGGDVAVDAYRPTPANLSMTVAPSGPEFDFEGASLFGYTLELSGPNRNWRITVYAATGSVDVVEF